MKILYWRIFNSSICIFLGNVWLRVFAYLASKWDQEISNIDAFWSLETI